MHDGRAKFADRRKAGKVPLGGEDGFWNGGTSNGFHLALFVNRRSAYSSGRVSSFKHALVDGIDVFA